MKGEPINGTAILEAAIRAFGSGYQYAESAGGSKVVTYEGFMFVLDCQGRAVFLHNDGSARGYRGVMIDTDGQCLWDDNCDRTLVGAFLGHVLVELSRAVNGPSIDTTKLTPHLERTLIERGVLLPAKG